ncbi:MAG TPA: lipopolysaccharide transport periplasmic protein LptA [Gammaproteobacteria bacterium]|nr:lipopolysaccharide transport periplasmic protein LptA [Gammaproteobacteria bacterium]|tara:strand:- start:119 stop:607 length:489 start_codon:yes stop_codon:yes gene_type:complete
MEKRFFIGLIPLIPALVFALPEDRDESIKIEADNALINEKENQAKYSGAVVVTQGTLKIEGDVVNLKTNENGEVETVVAKGKPARFESMRRRIDKKSVKGEAEKIYYTYETDRIVLTGDAVITSEESAFSGSEIIYDLDSGRVIASGDKSQRVNMTLQPKNK